MPYIIVSKLRGASPRPVEHEDKDDAIREAKRLADLAPEDRFTIYASVLTVEANRYQIHDASPGDLIVRDAPPF